MVYLPGHPPYYITAAELVAKIYSSSMMANLNSRVKAVSNTPAPSAPVWNESEQVAGGLSMIATGRSQMVFHSDSEVDGGSSNALDTTP